MFEILKSVKTKEVWSLLKKTKRRGLVTHSYFISFNLHILHTLILILRDLVIFIKPCGVF